MITSIIVNAIFIWLFIGEKEVVVLQITYEPASIITNGSPVRLFFSVNKFMHPQSSQLFRAYHCQIKFVIAYKCNFISISMATSL